MDDSTRDPSDLPRALRQLAIAWGVVLFRVRDYLFPAIVLVLVTTTTPGMPLGDPTLDHWLDLVGFTVACMGQGFRLLASASVDSIRRRGDNGSIAAQALIRRGLYTSTRNPLYLGNWLIVVGLVLIANCSWWYLLVLPAFTLGYACIVLAEEDFLTRKFGGEYAAYAAAVNRFVPGARGLWRVLTSGECDWRRGLSKEARVFLSWSALAVVLLLWEERAHLGAAMWAAGVTQVLLAILLGILLSRGFLTLLGRSAARTRGQGPLAAGGGRRGRS
jgi:protein-S-isoprenylcysteine O-methyltransferase Ste14